MILLVNFFFFQTVFYLFLGAWVLGLDILLGSPYSLDQLFSYKVWSLHPLFKLNTLNVLILPLWQSSFSSGAGGEPLRGQTLNRCFHLQLSNLFSWSLVHRTKDQAVSRLFVHGGKPHLLNDLKNFDFAQVHVLHLLVCLWWNTALPATLTW